MHPEPDFESSATRRAYQALLGDNYDKTLFAHVELSSAAKAFARDLETAMEWNRGGINEWLNAWPPPGPYQPTLVTDRDSAFIGRLDRLEHSVRVHRIADFVSALGATFAVLSFSAQTDRRESSFGVAGTDGIVACESVLPVKLKRFGRPERDDWISETYEDPHDFSPLLAPIAAAIRAKGVG